MAMRRAKVATPKNGSPATLDEPIKQPVEIGGGWTEVDLIGSGFKAQGLKAFIMDATLVKQEDEKLVLVTQPNVDDITDERFPILVRVLRGPTKGDRNVVVATAVTDLDAAGACKTTSTKCHVLTARITFV